MKRLNLMVSMATMGLLFAAQPAGAEVYGYSTASAYNSLILSSGPLDIYNDGEYWHGYSVTPGTTGQQPYAVGLPTDPGANGYAINDFFVFDISRLTAPVTSATLQLANFYVSSNETVTFYDYTGSIPELISAAGNDSVTVPVWNDLQTGAVYGSHDYVTGITPLPYSDITLNSTFLSDLNADIAAHDQYFAFGGHATVTLPVPEANEWILMLLGTSFMAVVASRKKRLA